MENYFDLTFNSNILNVSFIRNVVASFLIPLNPTVEEINDVKTAVSEGVTNSIIHGYNSRDLEIIKLSCRTTDNSIEIKIKDNGVGIIDVKRAMEPFFTTKPNEERSGMGFTIMETFMDEVIVNSNENDGTELILKKSFKGSNDAEL